MIERMKMVLMGATLMALLLPAMAQNSAAPSQPVASPQTGTPTQTATPAQGATPSTTATPGPETWKQAQQRKWNQKDRIANGVASGQLTTGEAANLEKKESQLNSEERDMKAEDNGHLTTADRTALQQQQNQLSNQIKKDDNNSATQNTNPISPEAKRAENQQDRIAQGIKSSKMNAGQAANLEKQETAINQEVKADRAANGGYLTKQQKAQVNHEQNNVSSQIYKDKHNGNSNKKKP